MSPRQNHIHVTWGDLLLRHVPNPFSQGLWSQGRPAIGLFTDLSQRHVASAIHMGDRMCVRYFVAATCRMNWNWFEFTQQVTTSNCIRTYMSHEATCHRDVSQWQGAATRRGDKVRWQGAATRCGDKAQQQGAATRRGDRSPCVTGPLWINK